MRVETHVVDVAGVGSFEVRRPIMRTAIAVEVEYARLTEGIEVVPPDLAYICRVLSYLKVMVVSAPDGWDVDNVDPYDEGEVSKLREVHDALTEAEARFRQGAGKESQTSSEGTQ